ncbi:MAG: hypothetical protein J6T98_06695 [Salinivirgaceae bacterium]|nr:hypothetical protein [Salinivirgaceae bacterium]
MKIKTAALLAAIALAGCKVDNDSCPEMAQVPFESVEIPDSVEAGQTFTIDVKLYDYGCYKETSVVGGVYGDTVRLEAYANYDECDCPAISSNLQLTYKTQTDTSLRNTTLRYIYLIVNNTKDSLMVCCDSIRFY